MAYGIRNKDYVIHHCDSSQQHAGQFRFDLHDSQQHGLIMPDALDRLVALQLLQQCAAFPCFPRHWQGVTSHGLMMSIALEQQLISGPAWHAWHASQEVIVGYGFDDWGAAVHSGMQAAWKAYKRVMRRKKCMHAQDV